MAFKDALQLCRLLEFRFLRFKAGLLCLRVSEREDILFGIPAQRLIQIPYLLVAHVEVELEKFPYESEPVRQRLLVEFKTDLILVESFHDEVQSCIVLFGQQFSDLLDVFVKALLALSPVRSEVRKTCDYVNVIVHSPE